MKTTFHITIIIGSLLCTVGEISRAELVTPTQGASAPVLGTSTLGNLTLPIGNNATNTTNTTTTAPLATAPLATAPLQPLAGQTTSGQSVIVPSLTGQSTGTQTLNGQAVSVPSLSGAATLGAAVPAGCGPLSQPPSAAANPLALSPLAQQCSQGNVSACQTIQSQIAAGTFVPPVQQPLAPVAVECGPSTPGGTSVAQYDNGVTLALAQQFQQNLNSLGSNSSPVASALQTLLTTLQQNGGNIQQATAQGNLVAEANALLAASNSAFTQNGLAVPAAAATQIQTALPGLATGLQSGQLSVPQLFQTLQGLGGSSILQNLSGILGGSNPLAATTPVPSGTSSIVSSLSERQPNEANQLAELTHILLPGQN